MINKADEYQQIIEFLKNLPNFRPLYQYLNLKIEEVDRGSCRVYLPHDSKDKLVATGLGVYGVSE